MNWCNRCGHAWNSKKEKRPRQCPSCWSYNWDKTESRLSFKFCDIELGQTKLYEWYQKNGKPDPVKNHKIGIALTTYEHHSKRKFQRNPTYQGLNVTRIA